MAANTLRSPSTRAVRKTAPVTAARLWLGGRTRSVVSSGAATWATS